MGIVPANNSPVLIIMGALMIETVKEIDFSDFTEGLPAFLTIAIMPFTYSIANGIALVLSLSYYEVGNKRHKEVHPIMYILAILFILRFALLP